MFCSQRLATGWIPANANNKGDQKHGKSRLFVLAAAHGASLIAVPPVLLAADTLEEIVVTARQREEKIEDVPVSITAFTAADIRSAGIERPQDFIALTPGYFFDRSLSLNAAIYDTDVEDTQFFNFFAGPFGLPRVVTNIDQVTMEGFEVDVNVRF